MMYLGEEVINEIKKIETESIIKTKNLTTPVSVPSKIYTSFNLGTVPVVDGYTFVGITARTTGYADLISVTYSTTSSGTIYAIAYNTYSSALTSNFGYCLIYIKN